MATTEDLYTQLVLLNNNVSKLVNRPTAISSSWQLEYLKRGWAYKHISSLGNEGSLGSGQTYAMGSNVSIIGNQVINGLLHFMIIGLAGSLDCRDATIFISDAGPGQAVAIGIFPFHELNDIGLNGWMNTIFSSSLTSDTEKAYVAIYAPSYPIPIHNLAVRVTLPQPNLDPSITECQISWDGLFSSPLNYETAAGYINKNATTTIQNATGEYININSID